MNKKWRTLSDSQYYQKDRFVNLSNTPMMAEGVSYRKVLQEFLHKPKSVTPPQALPSVKTDLKALRSDTPAIVWFGHSSYLIHCRGINILIDPVFSGHASPVKGLVKAFAGADAYGPADMPVIDIMILTHNHYDHLDKQTLRRLASKTRAFYVPLGVGKDVAGCNNEAPITEMDWWETVQPAPGIQLTATPGRHFSGRGLKRGGSLWSSYVLDIYGFRLFLGGDSGYDTHFREIGEKYGPFDLAILECGQYNKAWPYIHMQPEETVQAATELKAKVLMPVHWAKFALAYHPWNEPIERITRIAEERGQPITTPIIGEPVVINQQYPQQHWWNF